MAMTPAEVKLAKVLMDNGYSFFESAAIVGAVNAAADDVKADARIGPMGMATLAKYATHYQSPSLINSHVEGVPER